MIGKKYRGYIILAINKDIYKECSGATCKGTWTCKEFRNEYFTINPKTGHKTCSKNISPEKLEDISTNELLLYAVRIKDELARKCIKKILKEE